MSRTGFVDKSCFCINNRSLLYVSGFMSFIKSMSDKLLVFENIYGFVSCIVPLFNYERHTYRCIGVRASVGEGMVWVSVGVGFDLTAGTRAHNFLIFTVLCITVVYRPLYPDLYFDWKRICFRNCLTISFTFILDLAKIQGWWH